MHPDTTDSRPETPPETSGETLWSSGPSVRALIPAFVLSGALLWGAIHVSGPAAQAIVDATAGVIPWTETSVHIPWRGIQALGGLPLLIVVLRALVLKTTRYALTEDRLLYTRGILMRRYDQIWLQRVRDFRVVRPLAARLTGTGSILVISRDETLPEITMGPFARPLEIEARIRAQVVAQQERVGFREFEST